MSEKVRVYEVARELGVENRDLIQRITALGIEVRNHMSVLDPAQVARVKGAFGNDVAKEKTPSMEETRVASTVVRRRRKRAPAPATDTEEKKGVAAEVAEKVEPELAKNEVVPAPAAEETPVPAAPPEPETQAVAKTDEPEKLAAEPTVDEKPEDPPTPSLDTAHLPPGVVGRGGARATGAAPLSEERRKRIVAEHAASRPRRQVRGPGSIAPRRATSGRPGKRRMAPGKKGKQTEITVASAHKRKIRIEDEIQLQKLAQQMSIKATDVLMRLMQLGVSGMHINSTLDADTSMLLAEEFGYEVENVARSDEELVGDARGDFEDLEADRLSRAPIVTIMGHVDHGKTSLLDKIRSANVAAGEAGGITQHISSFRVDTSEGTVVFLDTPGHEAFTEMRARGAQATDIVILVAAADDGVMPQTREAVSHSQAAEVPIVVAVNKIDKPGASPEKVMNELAALGLQPEEWGGDTMYINTSAITGQGIDDLLKAALLQSEILDLSSNPKIPAEGVVLEAYLDKGRGPVANVLIRNGTLRAGDYVVAGGAWGRVRAMTDDRGAKIKEAGPATPIEVLGMQEIPQAGDMLYVVKNQRNAQEVAASAKKPTKGPAMSSVARGLETLQAMLKSGDVEELKLVIKADVQGSVEALKKSLADLTTEKVKVIVIHTGVGGITENDVMLASASNAIILGFNVRPQGKANATAKKEGVEIRGYDVIYEAIDDVKAAMVGLLAPTLVEKDMGKAEVRDVFKISNAGTIAGSMVTEGKVLRSGKARLVRDGVVIWTGALASLQRFKDSVKEVPSGMECGIGLENFSDIKAQDIIECFVVEEIAPTLD